MIAGAPAHATQSRTMHLPAADQHGSRPDDRSTLSSTAARERYPKPVRGGPLHKRFLLELTAVTADEHDSPQQCAAAQLPRQQAAAQQMRAFERTELDARMSSAPTAAHRPLTRLLQDVGATEHTKAAPHFPLAALPTGHQTSRAALCDADCGPQRVGEGTASAPASDNPPSGSASIHSNEPALGQPVSDGEVHFVVAHMQQPQRDVVTLPRSWTAQSGMQRRRRMFGQEPRQVVSSMMRQRGWVQS